MTAIFNLGGVSLPEDLVWTDRFGPWAPVVQTTSYSQGGTMYVWESNLLAGKPITLEGFVDSAWLTIGDYETLAAMATTGQTYTLVCPWGQSIQVRFRGSEGRIQAEQLVDQTDPDVVDTVNSTPLCNLKIRLMTV